MLLAFKSDGSLVAVRIWVSSSFNTVWLSPEGHVRHVLSSSLVVDNEDGVPVTVNVDGNTQFFFRTPAKPSADAAPFCTGVTCLSDLVRGFKVHVTADPLQNPLLAQTVDIEIARFDGVISSPGMASFVYTRKFVDRRTTTPTMPYISSGTPNGNDPLTGGKPITGFKWWNFAFPTLQDNNTIQNDNPVPDFISATGGAVNFGGSVEHHARRRRKLRHPERSGGQYAGLGRTVDRAGADAGCAGQGCHWVGPE